MLQAATPFITTFDPVGFFAGKTLGHGVVLGPTGRVLKRVVIETEGEEASEPGVLNFDERYVFDDGTPEDLMHWAVRRPSPDVFDVSEVSVLGPLRSTLRGSEWKVVFTRQPAPPSKTPSMRYEAIFNQVSDDVVTKRVKVKLFGLPVGVLWGYHRKV